MRPRIQPYDELKKHASTRWAMNFRECYHYTLARHVKRLRDSKRTDSLAITRYQSLLSAHLVEYDLYCLMFKDEKPVLPHGLPEQELASLGAGGVAVERRGIEITRYSDASSIPASEDMGTALLLVRGPMCKSLHLKIDKASIADLKGFVGRLTEIEGKSQAQEAAPALECLAAVAKDDDTDEEDDDDEVHVSFLEKMSKRSSMKKPQQDRRTYEEPRLPLPLRQSASAFELQRS